MNLLEMFADSAHFQALQDSITEETELGQLLLETQGTVNAFVASIGQNLVSDFVADTYMMYGEVFSTEQVKLFSIAVVLYNRGTDKQTSFIIPFRLYLQGVANFAPGLYVVL
jgi:hypothetical protein